MENSIIKIFCVLNTFSRQIIYKSFNSFELSQKVFDFIVPC